MLLLKGVAAFVKEHGEKNEVLQRVVKKIYLKTKHRNAKEGIVLVKIADAESKGVITAEHLHSIKKIIKTVWRDIVIRKRHKGYFSVIHHLCKMRMGDG